MNTFQLQCFLAVSETLNFARAAGTSVRRQSAAFRIYCMLFSINNFCCACLSPQGEFAQQTARMRRSAVNR